jgi:hypothetical protein
MLVVSAYRTPNSVSGRQLHRSGYAWGRGADLRADGQRAVEHLDVQCRSARIVYRHVQFALVITRSGETRMGCFMDRISCKSQLH